MITLLKIHLMHQNIIQLHDNLILAGKLFLKAVNSIDDDVRVSKRVYIPSSRLRGFESGKIGPKDGSQYIGGNYGAALILLLHFQIFLMNLKILILIYL